MKNLLIIAMMFTVSIGVAQTDKQKSETKIAVASYTGSSTEGYYFTNDLDQSSMIFANVRPEVLNEYDLSGRVYIRETFRVTYIIEKIKGKKHMTIIGMELLDYDDDEDIEG